MKNLLIITGAGASYDVADSYKITVHRGHQPPLTDELFRAGKHIKARVCLNDNLSRNPIAHQIGVRWNEKGPLEKYLQDVKNGVYGKRQQALYWTIPIYLHDLFTDVSNNYIDGEKEKIKPSNYFDLILTITSRKYYDQLIWLNLNYDLFADYVIEAICDKNLSTLDDYMDMRTKEDGVIIKYTKPHGSINWYRKNMNDIEWDDIRNGKTSSTFGENLSGLYTIDGTIQKGIKIGGKDTYPAISAPLGKYEYVCPNHINTIKPILNNTNAILCIGFSARDKDILDLIKNNMPEINKLKIVNGPSVSDSKEAYDRMKNHIPQLDINPDNAIFTDGFSKFLKSEEVLNKWFFE